MANTLADAYVRLRADLAGIGPEIKAGTGVAAEEAGFEAGKKFGESFAESTKDLLKGAVTTIGVFGLAEVVKSAVEATDELAHATDAVKVAAEDAGIEWSDVKAKMGEAQKEGEKLGFTNEEIARSYSTLITRFHDVDIATKLLAGAEDYAALKHISLKDALEKVENAANGSSKAARQLGITFPAGATAAEKMTLALDALSHIHGQAEEATKSLHGQLKVLRAEFVDDSAEIGQHVVPGLNEILKGMQAIGPVATVALGAELLFGKKIGPLFEDGAKAVANFGKNVEEARVATLKSVQAEAALRSALADIAGSGGYAGASNQQKIMAQEAAKAAGSTREESLAFGGLSGAIGRAQGNFGEATGASKAFHLALGAGIGVTNVAKSAFSSLSNVLGGPVGVGLFAATIGVGLFSQALQKEAEDQKKLEDALTSLGREFNVTRDVTNQQSRDLIDQNKVLKDVALNADKYGISLNLIAEAAGGSQQAMDEFNAGMAKNQEQEQAWADATTAGADALDDTQVAALGDRDAIDKLHQAYQELSPELKKAFDEAQQYQKIQEEAAAAQNDATEKSKAWSEAAAALGDAYAPLVDLMGVLGDDTKAGTVVQQAFDSALKDVAASVIPAGAALDQYGIIALGIANSQENAGQKATEFSQVLGDIEHTAGSSKDTLSALTGVFDDIANSELSASDKASLLNKTWNDMYGTAANMADQTRAFDADLLNIAGTYTKDAKGVKTYSGSLDEHSRAMDDNSLAGIKNQDAISGAAKKLHDLFLADLSETGSMEEATKRDQERRDKLLATAKQTGLNTDATKALIEKYDAIPQGKNTDITVSGFDKVLADLTNSLVAQHMLTHPGETQNEARRTLPEWAGGQSRAKGGPIFGAGGPEQDNIRVWASAGEFMHRRSAVDYYGLGIMNAINNRLIPKNTLHRIMELGDPPIPKGRKGYADGGLIAAFLHRLPTDAWRPDWQFPVDMSHTKIPDPMAAFGPNVGAALSFLKAQDGKPYGWAQAGPGAYDCSGIVSAVWNVMHGLNPYSHTFSTSNEAPFFPRSGTGGIFTAGWTNPGEGSQFAGGGDIGHTAGVIAGVPFESTGSQGVHMVNGVTPLSRFAHVGHFDTGGTLERGWNAMYNGLGHREHLTPDDQTTRAELLDAINRLIKHVDRVAPGVGQEINGAARTTLVMARSL